MENKTPGVFFSVIMPTYNRAFCITDAIDAILKQTYQNFELIIVDDGSNDNTDELINETYADALESKKITYFKMPENKGVSAARNHGLELSQNPWIAYADTDNIPTVDFLETFAQAIQSHNAACYYAKVFHIRSKAVFGSEFKYASLLKGNLIDLGAFVHSRKLYETYGGFDTRLTRLVDWDLILTYTKKNRPYFIDKIVLSYNDSNSIKRISNTSNHDQNKKLIWNKHAGIFRKLFNKRKKGDLRKYTFFGLPFSYRKNAHYLLHFWNEFLSLMPFSHRKTYAYILSLGKNCEFAFQFRHYFRFLESGLFDWCSVMKKDNFLDCLKTPESLFSEGIEEWPDVNMWKCEKYDIAFHGRSHPQDLLNENGEPDAKLKKSELDELKSRTAYLANKFKKVLASPEKKLFLLTLHQSKKEEADSISFILKVYEHIQQTTKNGDLLIVMEKDFRTKNIQDLEKSHPHLFIRTVRFFSPSNAITKINTSDYKSWAKIFREFRPKNKIKNQDKTYKYDQESR